MTELEQDLPTHKEDFTRVYDLEDPSPYFTALRPANYRMPGVLASTLKTIRASVVAAKKPAEPLRLLDFACGYGTIGALLRHDVSIHELYAWYAKRTWKPDDGRRFWSHDGHFFGERNTSPSCFEIGGTDIAGVALEYAATLGFLDKTFHENLIDDSPSEAFQDFIRGTDLVVESGSLGGLLEVAFARVLDVGGATCQPWFIYSPRPDVDWEPLDVLWKERG